MATIEAVWFDADGVLVDSHVQALHAARQILRLFGMEPGDSNRIEGVWNAEVQRNLVGDKFAADLRMLHRLLMRQAASKRSVTPFENVIEIASLLRVPRNIMTSALAGGIRDALGNKADLFREILGFDHGPKREILPELLGKANTIFVTDTVFDIRICKSASVPVIAVGWGYDEPAVLLETGPEYFAERPEDLRTLFHSLNLL